MGLKFAVGNDCKTYTAVTSGRVYEIRAKELGAHSASWELRFRPRACRVDGHGRPIHDWQIVDTYRNPATAMAFANEKETSR